MEKVGSRRKGRKDGMRWVGKGGMVILLLEHRGSAASLHHDKGSPSWSPEARGSSQTANSWDHGKRQTTSPNVTTLTQALVLLQPSPI